MNLTGKTSANFNPVTKQDFPVKKDDDPIPVELTLY